MSRRKRIIVVGAGFAGLKAATLLARHSVDILLVDRNNYHTFTPLLYQVATCGLDVSAVAYPIRGMFSRNPNVEFLFGNVQGINTCDQTISVVTPNEVVRSEAYDFLVITAGSETNYYDNEHFKENTFALRTLNDAVSLRNHILRMFEKAAWTNNRSLREAMLTFVVIGGGSRGLETAGALQELYNRVLEVEYEKNERMRARVVLVEARDQLLKNLPHHLQKAATSHLESLGVEVRTGTRVDDVTPSSVIFEDGAVITAHTVIWCGGIKANSLSRLLDTDLQLHSRIPIEATLEVTGLDNVFAAGEIAYLENPDTGKPYPRLIPVARQQGALIARNIMRRIQGEALEHFVYFDRGQMTTIGRKRAVAWAFNRVALTGMVGWFAWVVLHVLVLMGMRNRARVFLRWVWNYIAYDGSGYRILNDEQDPGFHPSFRSLEKIISLY